MTLPVTSKFVLILASKVTPGIHRSHVRCSTPLILRAYLTGNVS